MQVLQGSRFKRYTLALLVLLLLGFVTSWGPVASVSPVIAQTQPTAASPVPTRPVTATPATTPGAQSGQTTYEDPAGRFSVPVPVNWTIEPTKDYLLLRDPDKAIKMYILVLPASSADKAITAAWAIVDPSFKLAAQQTTTPPSAPSIDETLAITYDAGSQRLVQAVAQRVKDQAYVLILDGSMDAVARRVSQVQIVGSGLTIKGLQKSDLTNVTPKTLTPEMLAELEGYISEAMKAARVPGAEVAIVQNGKIVYLKGFGVREMGKTDPVTPDTLMMIGSTGKTMTTMMMGTLVDDGKMQWDTPAVKILPSFAVADPDLTQKITMRNLVCACTGVPRRDLELLFNARHMTADDVVKSLKGFQFFTKFGEAFQYSNQMVGTAGYIATVAGSGQSKDLYQAYVSQIQQRIFDPIGMTHTTFSFDKVRATADHATPHGMNILAELNPIPLSTEELLSPVAPAGASWSTASDMARYLITELNEGVSPDGQRVISAENLKVTWQPQVAIAADTFYGLGWIVDKYKGLPLLHHGGNTLGFTSDLAFLPAAKLGIAVISNAQGSVFNQAVRFRLFELVYGQPKEFDPQYQYVLTTMGQMIKEQTTGLQKTLDAAALKPYLGTFSNDALGTITLKLQDDKLTLTTESFSAELRRNVDKAGKTMYVMFDGPLAGLAFDFKQDDAGKPLIVLSSATDVYQFKPK